MKDTYAKRIFIVMIATLTATMFLIGFVLGFVIVKVEDKLDDMHRDNLIILYGVDK